MNNLKIQHLNSKAYQADKDRSNVIRVLYGSNDVSSNIYNMILDGAALYQSTAKKIIKLTDKLKPFPNNSVRQRVLESLQITPQFYNDFGQKIK